MIDLDKYKKKKFSKDIWANQFIQWILQEVEIFLGGRLTDEIESENCLEMM